MELPLGCIVEGHGEVEAVPILVRRIAAALDPAPLVNFPQGAVIRVQRSALICPGGLENAIEHAARRVRGLLVLLDSDDDCPAQLGASLRGRAQRARLAEGSLSQEPLCQDAVVIRKGDLPPGWSPPFLSDLVPHLGPITMISMKGANGCFDVADLLHLWPAACWTVATRGSTIRASCRRTFCCAG